MDSSYNMQVPQSPVSRGHHSENSNFPVLSFQSPLTRLAHHPPSSDEEENESDVELSQSTVKNPSLPTQKQTETTQRQTVNEPANATMAPATIEKDTIEDQESSSSIQINSNSILPIPAYFEEPSSQHRLDIRWEVAFYKSLSHCKLSRRRYMARCKYCNYEMEGRPERLERHVLLHCKKIPIESKNLYKDTVQRQGKLTVSEDEVAITVFPVLSLYYLYIEFIYVSFSLFNKLWVVHSYLYKYVINGMYLVDVDNGQGYVVKFPLWQQT